MALIYNTTFIFTLYHPQDDGTIMFNGIPEVIDNTVTEYPSVNFHICVNFNIHHKETTQAKLKKADTADFSAVYELIKITEESTHISDATGHRLLLDLFLTAYPEKCFAKVLPHHLGTSVSKLTSNQRHPLMCCSIEQFFST